MTRPLISVVIATCNRPAKLARLLECCKQQDLSNIEIIVVDDASTNETISQYQTLWATLDERFTLHQRTQQGGPAQCRNTGISQAQGEFIAFCDDDDYWTRTDHLSVAYRALKSTNTEFYFANMQTSADNVIVDGNWYSVITQKLASAPIAGESDIYLLNQPELENLLYHRTFHSNTLVLSRALLTDIGMYWDKISFAEDNNLAFRLVDRANKALFRTTVTADFDVSYHPTISRRFSEHERVLFSLLSITHAESLVKSASLRKVARANRAWRVLELANFALQRGDTTSAMEFIKQSLLIKVSKRSILMFADVLKKSITGKK